MSQVQNVPFRPISVLDENFNPQNTQCIPPVKIFIRLDLNRDKRRLRLERFETGSGNCEMTAVKWIVF